jgi:D-3-phosphoglycerate dehydrogenase
MGEVLQRSDCVTISMPATTDTIGCIDRRRLGLMKSTAYLINVSRAEIAEEDALYEALAENIRCVAHGETPLNLVAR